MAPVVADKKRKVKEKFKGRGGGGRLGDPGRVWLWGQKGGRGGGEGGDRESRGGFGGHQVCIWGLDKGGGWP